MAKVQMLIEVEKDFKKDLLAMAKAEDRSLRSLVTRLLRDAIAIHEDKAHE